MKKIFTLSVIALMSVTLMATERVVWTGTKAISWNTDVFAGEQFETPDGTFTGLLKDDVIKVAVEAKIDEPQYVMTYKAGTDWTWTDLEGVTVAEGVMSYTVASDEIATFIAERGLVFRGQGYEMTQISIATADPEQPEDPEPLQPGEERVLWEGNETLAWNEVAEQPAEVGALLGENDKLIVTVSAKGSAEWPKVLLRDASSNPVGEDILLNEVTEFPFDVIFTLTATDVEALAGGFKVCGDGVTVTKLVLKKYNENEEPEVIDYTGLVETVVYAPESPIAISWDNEAWAGIKLDTRNVSETMFAGLQEGHIIRVEIVDDEEYSEYSLQYKAGDDWAWTDLALELDADGNIAYVVESDEMAMLIADRGLVVQGIRFKVSKISVFGENALPSDVDAIETLHSVFNGQRYNILGQQVGENYKGIVIMNGKKFYQQ